MRTFEFKDGSSNKFWNIELKVKSFTVTFGRIGTAGQTQTKDFPDAAKAQKAYDKLIAEKTGKGYIETTAGGAPKAATPSATAITPVQQMLEKGLGENFHDLATHSAYADHLLEQNDPRGELVQTQLSLEDASKSAAERKTLKAAEAKLLKKLGDQLLGKLKTVMDGDWCGPKKPYHYEITRGWLTMLRTLPAPDGIVSILAAMPEARLLQRLEIVYDMEYHPWDFDPIMQGPIAALKKLDGAEDDAEEGTYASRMYDGAHLIPPLIDSPYLNNLRSFKLGFSDHYDELEYSTMVGPFNNCNDKNVLKFLEKCPHLEELYINTGLGKIENIFSYPKFDHLKLLQYYYAGDDYSSRRISYPLSVLAKNQSLANIHTLKFHPGKDSELDIDEVSALVKAKNLPNLKCLQLHMSTYGDAIVKPLIQSRLMQRLKVLDIGYGNLTDKGASELAACSDLKNLELLNVSRNALTNDGIKALKATGCGVKRRPLAPREESKPSAV
jgi:predicted DNA-binding WGR domain protein